MTETSPAGPRAKGWSLALLILATLLMFFSLLTLPRGATFSGGFWVLLVALICFWMLLAMAAPPARRGTERAGPRMLLDQPEPVKEVMNVQIATEQEGIRVFRGRLRESAATAYEKLKRAFGGGAVPLVQQDDQAGEAIVLIPRRKEEEALERPVRPGIHWLLLGLTVITTTYAGAAHQGVNLLREPERLGVGLPYALGLLAILGVHELGHYFTAKKHGMRVTPPFFIPVPFALGTFGAFIQMRSPAENRRALFDVAVAGPLAGLVVAIPAVLVGLQSSTVLPGNAAPGLLSRGGTSVGSSVLFALLSKLALGDALEYGHLLRLSPLAFAGWLGLLITALNLLPIGQLDGGHMARAMFGRRAGETISSVAMWSLLLLAVFVWPGLLMWALVVFFLAGAGAPPLNDLTPITPARRWVGYAVFLILAAILSPFPPGLWEAMGIYCPYA